MAAAPPSVLFSLLQAIQTAIVGLGLTDWDDVVVPVYLRKLPVIREQLETVPCITVCFDPRPESTELADSEGNSFVWYRVEVGAVLPSNESATDRIDYFTGWRQEVRRLFQMPRLANVTLPPEIVNILVDPKETYARGGFAKNYDENLLTVRAQSYEPAS